VLARRGVTGPREVLDAPWGGLFSTYAPGEADPAAPLHKLGEGYRILRKGFKPYPVCWGINSSADAMLELRAKHELAPENVKHVRVVLSEMSRRMIGGTHLDSVLEAQMSVTYALACIIRFGRLTLREFTRAAVADKVTRALMQRITLVVDPEAHGERQTLEVETRDGHRFASRIEVPLGHWDNPQSDDALHEKFLRLAGAALGAARAEKAADLVARIDKPGALARLFPLLRPA
jgi:2-methylcitrate dehydratase PrpD